MLLPLCQLVDASTISQVVFVLSIYCTGCTGVKYCDECVCLCVSSMFTKHISRTRCPVFIMFLFMLPIAVPQSFCGSVVTSYVCILVLLKVYYLHIMARTRRCDRHILVLNMTQQGAAQIRYLAYAHTDPPGAALDQGCSLISTVTLLWLLLLKARQCDGW